MQSVDCGPRIERNDWLAEFFREANLSQRAAFSGQRDYRIGAGDNHGIARLADAGGNHEFDMPVRIAAIITRDDSDRMPAFLARTGRRGFHHARAPAVQQDSAAPSDLAADLKRELTNGTRRITRTNNCYNPPPFHRRALPQLLL